MGLTRLSTRGKRIIIEFDGRRVEWTPEEAQAITDTTDFRTRLQAKAGRALQNIYFHKNRNGTYQVQWGGPIVVPVEDEQPDVFSRAGGRRDR